MCVCISECMCASVIIPFIIVIPIVIYAHAYVYGQYTLRQTIHHPPKLHTDSNDAKNPEITTIRGLSNIQTYINDACKDPTKGSFAIRDDWKYWNSKAESDDSGKILLINSSNDDTNTNTDTDTDINTSQKQHHIFFDDNIERTSAHIVDARDVVTGESLPFKHTQDVWLMRAEPYHAISQKEYFIKAVQTCEQNFKQLYTPTHTSTQSSTTVSTSKNETNTISKQQLFQNFYDQLANQLRL